MKNTPVLVSTFKPLQVCQDQLKFSWSQRFSLWVRSLFTATCLLIRRQQSARPAILTGLSALVKVSKRHVAGYVLLGVGAVQIFAHHLFFDQAARDYTWIYLNWWYYFFTNNVFLVIIWWSAGFIMFVPTKYSLSFIPFSLAQSVGWTFLIHNSFFVQVNEDFHVFPHWSVVVMALSFGFGVIMSLNYVMYWWHHKSRGNHARFVGVAEMPLAPEEKELMFKSLAREYRQLQKTI